MALGAMNLLAEGFVGRIFAEWSLLGDLSGLLGFSVYSMKGVEVDGGLRMY